MPEITNPRALLAEIREVFDLMMEHGAEHITTSGVRINLRSFLGKCDELLLFVHPSHCPTSFDWAELQSLRQLVETKRAENTQLRLLLEDNRGIDQKLDQLEAEVREQRKTAEDAIAKRFGQHKLELAREAFDKGYAAGQEAARLEFEEILESDAGDTFSKMIEAVQKERR
jgi:hypothetical protein